MSTRYVWKKYDVDHYGIGSYADRAYLVDQTTPISFPQTFTLYYYREKPPVAYNDELGLYDYDTSAVTEYTAQLTILSPSDTPKYLTDILTKGRYINLTKSFGYHKPIVDGLGDNVIALLNYSKQYPTPYISYEEKYYDRFDRTNYRLVLEDGLVTVVITKDDAGHFIGPVSGPSQSTYPDDGVQGSYWYTYQGSDNIDPTSVSHPSSIRGGDTVTVSLKPSTGIVYGGTITYTYQYSTNGGSSWITARSTTNTSIAITVPKGSSSFRVRVRANDNLGFTSSTYVYSTQAVVINNTPPVLTGSITIPSTILGGKDISITWPVASDVDDNLAGYYLFRSTNGGSSYTQIYQGPANSFTDSIDYSWDTVTYRAQAYDTEGATSGFIYSSTVSVIHNNAPLAPETLTIPDLIGGMTARISWSASVDPENNIAGYILERKRDDEESFTQVYKGANTYYDDSIVKGWVSVTYRVKAYDTYNFESPYTTSEVTEVNNNTIPVISGEDTDLGTLQSFSYEYTVTDTDEGQTLTVVEKIDDVEVRSFVATSGASNTFSLTTEDWLQLTRGSHTATITADDGNGGIVKRILTFSREVTSLSVTLIEPMECDAMATRMYAIVSGTLPEGCVFTFHACNNAFDEAPTWEDVTNSVLMRKKFYFSNSTKTAEKWGVSLKLSVQREDVPIDNKIYIYKIEGGFDGYTA